MPKPSKSPASARPAASRRPAPAAQQGELPLAKAPKTPLPPSLVQSLPASKDVIKQLADMVTHIKKLEGEMAAARKAGAIPLARSFVVLHRLVEKVSNDLKPLSKLFEEYKTIELPKLFENDGITSLPLAEGYRVGVSSTLRASIRDGMRGMAYQWLRANKMGDLITDTINSSSLSSTARTMLEEDNRELPEEIFNVVLMPNTSVTKI